MGVFGKIKSWRKAGRDRARSAPRPILSAISLALAVLTAPLVFRLIQLYELGREFRVADLRGLLSDVAVSAIVAALLATVLSIPARRAGRIAGGVILLGWLALTCGNYEHIRALGTMISWVYAGFMTDRTFLTGSVLHLTHPWLTGLLAVFSFAAYWFGTGVRSRQALLGASAVAVVSIVALVLWPLGSSAATWRQRHFLTENLYWLGHGETITSAKVTIPGLYPADLSGDPIIELGHPGTNVLLVVLEGISGAYLDSVARFQRISEARPQVPVLDQRARQHFSYVNFFNQQRQTNRGLYAVLCGNLPKLGTYAPKMAEYGWGKGELECLPSLLRRMGYETFYVQASPIEFMGKDRFMPRAGFDQLIDRKWYNERTNSTKWGVDDGTFFEQSIPLIEQIRGQDRPWLITMLTVGTHHPYRVPEGFDSGLEPKTFGHAIQFLNHVLGPFLEYIESSGMLRDTLVLITSDESAGLGSGKDNDSVMLGQAFGTLTAMVPGQGHRQIVEPYMQADIALSVLDYLGYRDDLGSIGGRSIFREYTQARAVPFSNTYLRMTGALSPEGAMFVCIEDFSTCTKYRLPENRFFGPERERVKTEPGETDFMKRIVALSLHNELPQSYHGELVATGVDIPLPDRESRIKVFSRQYLSAPAGTRIDVDIEFQLLGDNIETKMRHLLYAVPRKDMPTAEDFAEYRASEEGRKKFGIDEDNTLGARPRFSDRNKKLYSITKTMRSGDVFKIKYSYRTAEDLERLDCGVHIWIKSGHGAKVRFKRARLQTGPMKSGAKTGLDLEYTKLKRAKRAPPPYCIWRDWEAEPEVSTPCCAAPEGSSLCSPDA